MCRGLRNYESGAIHLKLSHPAHKVTKGSIISETLAFVKGMAPIAINNVFDPAPRPILT